MRDGLDKYSIKRAYYSIQFERNDILLHIQINGPERRFFCKSDCYVIKIKNIKVLIYINIKKKKNCKKI